MRAIAYMRKSGMQHLVNITLTKCVAEVRQAEKVDSACLICLRLLSSVCDESLAQLNKFKITDNHSLVILSLHQSD